jgi:hypothetical protein
MSIIHIIIFSIWTTSGVYCLRSHYKSHWFFEFIFGISMAAAAEGLERWMPHHEPDWRGFFASSTGVILGLAIAVLGRNYRKNVSVNSPVHEVG